MAITFFGVASAPADNGAQAGASVAVTPPASMLAGDLVVVFQQIRTLNSEIEVNARGGQAWSSSQRAGGGSGSNRVYWCRFNGTWATNPSFTNRAGGTTATTVVMLVYRPTDGGKFWVPDVWPIDGTFVAGTTPFTKTITGITTIKASTVSVAAWFTSDDNTWGSLAGTGWVKTSLAAQYRNTTGTDQSATFAYQIKTSAGATNNVSQNQATLGGDAGATFIMSFAEIDLPTGGGGSGAAGFIQGAEGIGDDAGGSIAATFGTAVTSGHMVVGKASFESISNRPVFPITDNQGNEYVPIQCVSDLPFDQMAITFFRPNITNGPVTVTCTFTGTGISRNMVLHEVRGMTALDVYDGKEVAAIDAGSPETTSAPAITTTQDGAYVFGTAHLPGNVETDPWFDMTAWGTERQEGVGAAGGMGNFVSADTIKATAGAITVSADMPGGRETVIFAAAFIPVVDLAREVTVADASAPSESIPVHIPMQVGPDQNLVNDSVTVGEFVAVALSAPDGVFTVSVFDVAAGTEAVTVQIPMAVVVADDDLVADAVAVTVTPLVPVVFDTTPGAEAVTVQIPLSVVVFDSDVVTEAVEIQRTPLLIDVADVDTATESVVVQISLAVVVADGVGETETVLVTVNPLAPDVADTVSPTEAVAVTVSPLTVAVSDDDVATESVVVAIPMAVVVADDVPAAEFVDIQRTPLLVDVSDTDLAGESVLVINAEAVVVQAGESDSPAEAVAVQIPMSVAVTDDLLAIGAVAVQIPMSVVVTDDALFTEAVTIQIPMAVVVAEVVGETEAVTVVVNPLVPVVEDTVIPAESVAVTVAPLTVSVSDTDTAGEAVSVSLPMLVVVSDDDPAAEFVAVQRNPLTVNVSDVDVPGESVVVLSEQVTLVQVSDVDSPSELVTLSLLMAIAVSDALVPDDVVLLTTPLRVDVSDSVTPVESVVLAFPLSVLAIEAALLSEFIAVLTNPLMVAVSDDDVAVDAVLVFGGGVPMSVLAVDSIVIAERRSVLAVGLREALFVGGAVLTAMVTGEDVEE